MEVQDFKICNFRSIVDTGWRKFSPDKVTVLIGQNESGKTSVLEALSKTFSSKDISDDDKRIGDPLPKVYFRVKLDGDDIKNMSDFLSDEGYNQKQIEALSNYLEKTDTPLELLFQWTSDKAGEYKKLITVINDDLEGILKNALPEEEPEVPKELQNDNAVEETQSPTNASEAPQNENKPEQEAVAKQKTPQEAVSEPDIEVTLNAVADAVYEASPTVTLFEHETGLLPSQIDIVKNKAERNVLNGQGAVAAQNFLTVAGLELGQLVTSDDRTIANLLSKANDRITKDFLTFWSQTIGRSEQLKLECELKTYGPEAGEQKAGKRYLQFWINDNLTKLFPSQRSQGVRWFVSFYLQLKASEKMSTKRIFLLDEPGANLHSRAQADVKELITDLSTDIPIVYSTHIPDMLDYDKQYRILAVQRMGEADDSPTEIKPAHELGTASTDTLTPLLMAMGADFSSQSVVKKTNNVLLEEMSGFYYLKAFWDLTKEKQEAHFIAATGVNKLPIFANMFLGWGLNYIVVVDDDKSGRGVYKALKKDVFADDEELAKQKMYKIKGCDGIENIFSEKDFKEHVINDPKATISSGNAEYAKSAGLSKPVLAYSFLLKVRDEKLKLADLEQETQNNIKGLIKEITDRLEQPQAQKAAQAA